MIRVAAAAVVLLCGVGLHAQQAQTASPYTTVPHLIRIANSFRPADGSAAAPVESVTFAIYKEEHEGAPLWQETQNVTVDVVGRYSALLGFTVPDGLPADLFATGEPRWLGVRFDRPGEKEQPRVLLASVPYALKASDSDTLGGRPASAYLLDPNAAAGSAAGGATAGSAAGTSTVVPGKSPKPHTITGNMNYLPFFTDNSNDLGNSALYESGGNIGLGTTSPLTPLHIVTNGTGNQFLMRMQNTNSGGGANFQVYNDSGNRAQVGIYGSAQPAAGAIGTGEAYLYTSAPNLDFAAGAAGSSIKFMTAGVTERARIDPNGRLGIGTTTPAFPVDVVGTINANNPVTSGTANGVQGTSNSPNGAGVNGFNSVTSGGFPVGVQGGVTGAFGAGVSGNANQAGASGVNGYNSATSGYAVGVAGGTASNSGAGIQGNAQQAGAFGVHGNNSATSGYAVGVQGNTSSTSGAGVQGGTNQAGASGVVGNNNATSGYAVGVTGNTNSTGGAGVQGNAHNSGAFGVSGFNSATSGWAVGTQGASSSPGGIGLLGVGWDCSGGTGCNLVPTTALQLQTATTGALIRGLSGAAGTNNNTATTVFSVDGTGAGFFGNGVAGITNTVIVSGSGGNPGVAGLNTAATGLGVGAAGVSSSPGGVGIAGISGSCNNTGCALANGTAGALYTSSNNGGYLLRGFSAAQGTDFLSTTQVFSVDGQGNGVFAGNLTVGGNISKGGGSFRIDDPLDPENKYLYHSFVESPDMKNIYDGVATLDEKGEARVQLPDWFEALNQDFRYQLTCIGGYAPVYVASKVSGNEFHIAGGRAGLEVSWQVTGIRHDPYANAHRIPVEEAKPESERLRPTSLHSAPPAQR